MLLSKLSTIASSFGINDEAKWQFIRRAQPPLLAFSLMQSLAFLSYPLPSDIASYFFDIFISSANLKKSATGSEPGERTKINGVVPVQWIYFQFLRLHNFIQQMGLYQI